MKFLEKAKSSNFPTSSLIALLIITAGALFVRLYGLSEYYLTNDEAWHLVVADQKNLWEIIQFNFRQEIHPPLSNIIWHFALKISRDVLWLRCASLICSVALIPAAYLFGSLYISKKAGLFMALIVAFGALSVSIGASIRAYPMLMLALVFAAIFLFKYRQGQNKKTNLSLYFLCTLIAIELNHAAAFLVFAFGLILLRDCLIQKNKKDFLLIAFAHLFFAFLVIGYSYLLTNRYEFAGNYGYFSSGENLSEKSFSNLKNFIRFLTWFLAAESNENPVLEAIKSISIIAFIISTAALIRSKKWLLLHLAFTPIFAICAADYFGEYPFSPNPRNNLFLILSLLIVLGYFFQLASNFFTYFLPEKFTKNKICQQLQILALALATIMISKSFLEKNFFRNEAPNCEEFLTTKNDRDLMLAKLEKKTAQNNIFVTTNSNIWGFQFEAGKAGHAEYLTKNLAHFKNEKTSIYFTSFPERELGSTMDIARYKLFFADLFLHLKKHDELKKINSFTFFAAGNKALEGFFVSDFIKKSETKSQLISSSIFQNAQSGCNASMMIFSLKRKFIEEELIR